MSEPLPSWAIAWAEAAENCDALRFATGVLGFLMPGEDNPDRKPQLEPWQVDALQRFSKAYLNRFVAQGRLSIKSGHGVGKALHVDEPVLTPAGWVPIGQVSVGDKVAAPDGTFSTVTGVFPQGERDLFRVVLDDGCSVLADAGHLWLTQSRSERKHGKPGKVRTTREIAASLTFPNGPRAGLNHRLPRMRAVEHPAAALPLDPYLLGVLLGDGDARGRFSYGEDREIMPLVAAAGGEVGRETCTPNRAPCSTMLGAKPALRALGLLGCRAHEKFIPRGYLVGSVAQRTALLQGILDTDGTVGKNTAVVLEITAPRLADDVAELVRSLGGVVRRSGKQGRLNGVAKRWVYRLFISLPSSVAPFRLPSKVARYRPSYGHINRDRTLQRFIRSVEPAGRGEAVCIAVDHPSRLYVTRDHIVTHNTCFLSIIIIFTLLCAGPDTKIPVVANSQDQLRDGLWPELQKWLGKLPEPLRMELEWQKEKVVVKCAPEEAFAVRRTATKHRPEALQGIHAETVLAIFEEASGIPEETIEAGAGTLSTPGAMAVAVGNPTRRSGFFHATQTKLRDRWDCMTVSSESVPRARGHIQDIIDLYGRDSNKYRVRVLGEFPDKDDDTVIPLSLIEAAKGRQVATHNVWPVWGVDPGRFGDDPSTLVEREGNVVPVDMLHEWHGLDGPQLAGRIIAIYNALPLHRKPKKIGVDVIGVGASCYDHLRLEGSPVRSIVVGVNVAEAAAISETEYRLRDELWFRGLAFFQAKDCRFIDPVSHPEKAKLLEKLIGELSAPTYDYTMLGKRKVESKEDMKKRGVPSPNLADGFLLTLGLGIFPRENPHQRRAYYGDNSSPWAA
jgi:phage terminase large subunit